MSKKLLSKLFVLLLVVGLLFAAAPTGQAQAATTVSTETQLRDALLDTGVTEIELGADIALANELVITRAVTIDLNGKTLSKPTTTSVDRVFHVQTGGNLTVNATGGGSVSSPDTADGRAFEMLADASATMTINGGSFTAGLRNIVNQTNTLIVNGGTIHGEDLGIAVRGNRTTTEVKTTTLTVNDGTISSGDYPAVHVAGYGATFNLKGGLLTGVGGRVGAPVLMGNGTSTDWGTEINISGGVINAPGGTGISQPQQGVLNISGGQITADTGIEIKSGTLNMTGGSIVANGPKVDPPVHGPDGTTLSGDGVFVVTRTGYNWPINVNLTGGSISSTNAWAVREFLHATATESASVTIINGTTLSGDAGQTLLLKPVVNVTKSLAYTTIQAAINAAVDGDTIQVAAGTYEETVDIIDKDLTLIGQPGAIIKSPVEIPARTGTSWKAIVFVHHSDATIDGFTIDGAGRGNLNSRFLGVQFFEADGVLKNSTVTNVTWTPFNGAQEGIGFYAYNAVQPARSVSLQDNTFVNNQKGDVNIYGSPLNVIIEGNTFTGRGNTSILAQNGVSFQGGATGSVQDNSFSGYSYSKEPPDEWNWGAAGLLLYGAGDVTLGGGNNFTGNDNHLYIYDSGFVAMGAETFGPSTAPVDFGYFVINYNDSPLDLTQSTFPVTDPFDLAVRIWDGIDEAGNGLARFEAGNVYVNVDGSIQRAIDLATEGDIIHVAAGTYAELLKITKPLTLLGPNAGIDGTTGTRNLEAVITYPEVDNSQLSLIDAKSDDITVNGFTFTNNQIENTYSGGWDLILIGEDIEFINNRVISQAQRKIAFKIQGPFTDINDPNNDYAGAIVENNYFESMNTSWSSVIIQGIGATVQDNTMIGGSNGIQIQPYTNTVGGLVSHNDVSGYLMSIWHNYQIDGNGLWIYEYNNVSAPIPPITYYHYGAVGTWGGIRVQTHTPNIEVRYNTFNGENDDYTLDTEYSLERTSLGVYYYSGLYPESKINVHDNEFVNVDQNVQNQTTALGDLDEVFANNTFEKSAYIENGYLIYTSIQDAIDAAEDGDTILVGPGTYAEQIVINKALTIQGPNADKAGYAEDRVAEAIVTFPAGITALDERLVRIEADDVTILGMNFEYAEYMIGLRPQLLRVIDAGDVTIKNNRFYGGEAGIGTTVTGGAYYSGLVIEDNYINGGPFVNSAYNRGLYIWNTATTIKNNVIESTAIGVQIMPYNEPLGGLVEGNTINGLLYALYINQHQGDSGEWVYRNNSLGIAGTPSDGLTTPVHTPLAAMTARDHYAVYFNAFGTTAATTAPSVRIEGNFMDPTRPAGTFYPYRIQFLAFANSLTGSGNPQVLMMNNSIGAYPRPSGGTPARIHLNASGNWWGTTTQSTVSSRAGGANGDYSPWLASGTDTDTAAPGFQGDFSTLYVTDQGQHFGSTVGRIQEAIDLVSGSTIYVLPGTYQEAVVVDKAVNLYGPNMDVDPNGTVDRGPEAIILGSTTAPAMSTLFELDAENVVVKGFTFDNVRINNYIDGGATGTLTNQFGGVDISNNIFTYVSGTAVYLRDGRNAPGEYSAAVTVQNNLFNPIASAGGVDYNAGSAVVVMGAENLLVDGNVIEDAAYNGIQLARNKTVTVSNNTAVAAQPAIQIAQWNEGTQTISGNDLQTTHASKAAMRFYSFTTDRTPSFVIENNTIHDSVNGIQIGHGDAGKGDDISTADYSFADNTFTDISSHELVVYLPAEATSDQMTEMVEDFRQVYDDSVYVREINGSDPYTYVVDTAPVAVDDAYTTKEDTELVVSVGDGVLKNDTDAENSVLSAVLVTSPAKGSLTLNADGSFSYTPDLDYFGEDAFTYKVVSGETTSNIATVTITVTPEKDQVIANPDFYAVDEDSVLTVSVEDGVLANDEDVDLNHRQATLVESVKNGTLTLNADGSFVYTPKANFHGEDTFTYRLVTYPRINAENPWIDEALVTITVNPILDPPALSTDMPDSVMTGVEYQYGVTLDNPNYGDTFAGVRVLFTLSDTDLADIASLKYYEVQDGTWKDLPLTQDGANVTGWFGPAAGFPMTAPYNATSQFKLTMAVGSADTYAYKMDLYDVVADPDVLLTSLAGSLEVIESPVVTVQDFYYASSSTMKGVSADIRLDHGTTDDATSIVVELFAGEPGAYQLLQTNTANLEKFNAFTVFTSPFDIFGTRNYVGSSWSNVREAEYGQTLTPTRVLATITLLNGDVISDEEIILTGDSSMIQPSVVAEDFGYGRWSGILGVNAGFHTVNFNLGQAVDVKVELFTGEAGAYELLQTNTWIAENPAWDGMSVYSAPFDIFGNFDYAADGYWTNVREAEYGQTAIPTRVLTTITLPGGVIVTAENTNLTGDRRWIVSTLDEEIGRIKDYAYTPPYIYVGDIGFDDTTNTYHGIYTPAQFFDKRATFDLARLLGALHRQEGSTVQSITFNGKDYTWKFDPPDHPELKGSNWRDEDMKTLVSQVSDMVIAGDIVEEQAITMVVSDGYNTETIIFKFTVTNTLDAEIGSGFVYEYSDEYEYVGTREFDDPNNIYTVTYPETQVDPHAMYDLARYLGALYRQDDATVIAIAYEGKTYTWNAEGTLLGSNWEDEDGKTLVSVITADFIAGDIDPAVGIVLTVSDGIHTETVTFKMIITNVAPVLDPIADETIPELVKYTFTATASDVPTATLTFSLVGAPDGAAINASTGVFTWTPTEAQGPGEYTFTVKVCDNGTPVMCDDQEVTLTVTEVNIPPELDEIGDQTVVEGVELTFTATATDEDIPEQTLTFSLVGAPAGAEIDPATGIFTWTPTHAQVGEYTFEVCVSDGVAVVCEEITVTVTESVVVNEPPVAVDDAYETDEDVVLTINAPGVLANDSDPNGDAITAELVGQASHGTVVLAADGSFVYTPVADWNGTDTFTYKAKDAELYSEVATVTITVKPVNDAPVAVDDAYTVAEDTLLSIAAPGVLDNDYDVDGDVLNATVRTNPSNGTLSLNGDGSFTYMPNPNWHGTDTFTYNLVTHPAPTSEWTDWATVTITVTPVNDAPVLDPIADATIPEMVAYTFTATATDVDSTNLTFSLVGAPAGATINASTGVFTWTPTEEQGPGAFTFTVKVCDDATPALCDQQQVTLSVLEVNRAPEIEDIDDQEVAVGEELTFTAVATDPDRPAQTLSFRLENAPAGAAIDPVTGKFTWTPVESQIGEHEFHVCVTDGELNACTLVKVTVKQGHVNTPPVAVADAYAVDQDEVLTIAAPGVLENDTDADNDTLTALLVSTTSNGTLTFNADGSFVYTPRAGFFGTDTFTYKANDGQADSNVVTVTITVRKAEPVMPYEMYYPVILIGW